MSKEEAVNKELCCVLDKDTIMTSYVWLKASLKTHCVNLSVLLFLFSLVIGLIWSSKITFTLTAASLGAIFAALKYKLDQANYNKDLFDKRYEVFQTYEDALHKLCNIKFYELTVSKITKEILDPVFRKSYFLFGEDTNKFLLEFRGHAVTLVSFKEDDSRERVSAMYEESYIFINNLLNGHNLSDKFPELKLDSYLNRNKIE